jgi:hypothetical protein
MKNTYFFIDFIINHCCPDKIRDSSLTLRMTLTYVVCEWKGLVGGEAANKPPHCYPKAVSF